MKTIKLSVDLNELSDDELALYLKLKGMSNQSVMDDKRIEIAPVEIKELIKKNAKYLPETEKDKLYYRINQELAKGHGNFMQLFKQYSGRATCGAVYHLYKTWCADNGFEHHVPAKGAKGISRPRAVISVDTTTATIPKIPNHTGKRKRKSSAFYKKRSDKYMPVWEIMKKGEGKVTFMQAYQQAYKTTPAGFDYRDYRKFCQMKNLKTFMQKKRRYHFKAHNDKKAKPIVASYAPTPKQSNQQIFAKKNPFLQFKNKHIGEYTKRMNVRVQVAMKMLAQIWNNNNKNPAQADIAVKNSYNLLFPDLIGKGVENDGLRQIMIDMFRNIINISGTTLSYKMEGTIIGITNANQWENFCENVMLNAKEIAQFFHVDNKFVITGAGVARSIRYENKK